MLPNRRNRLFDREKRLDVGCDVLIAQSVFESLSDVQSQPPGAKVIVDGTERGVAPVTVRWHEAANLILVG